MSVYVCACVCVCVCITLEYNSCQNYCNLMIYIIYIYFDDICNCYRMWLSLRVASELTQCRKEQNLHDWHPHPDTHFWFVVLTVLSVFLKEVFIQQQVPRMTSSVTLVGNQTKASYSHQECKLRSASLKNHFYVHEIRSYIFSLGWQWFGCQWLFLWFQL